MALVVVSTLAYRGDDLSFDYTIFEQARFLIAHGHLDPFDSVNHYWYWQNHGELLMWPLALLTSWTSSGLVLLWVQDAATVVAGLLIVDVVDDVLQRRGVTGRGRLLPLGFTAALLLLNPWIYWSDAYDFHFQTLALLFVALAAKGLVTGRRRLLVVGVVLALATGDVAGTYVVGLGLVALACRDRRLRRRGIGLVVAGFSWVVALSLLHANLGSHLATYYGYLARGRATAPSRMTLAHLMAGVLTHPGRVAAALWAHRVDLWANVEASGIAGLATPFALLPALVLVANSLISGFAFSAPIYQSMPVYGFLALGSGVFLARVLAAPRRRHRVAGAAVALVSVGLCVGTFVTWIPRVAGHWLITAPAAASELGHLAGTIPPSAEVVVSDGVAGRFANRPFVDLVTRTPVRVPIRARLVYFVLAPSQGAEIPSVSSDELLAQIARLPGARLAGERSGVWTFRYVAPPGRRELVLGATRPPLDLPAWPFRGAAGVRVLDGPPTGWRLESSGAAGYVLNGDTWLLQPGTYRVTLQMATSGPCELQALDGAGSVLASRIVPATVGQAREVLRVHVGPAAPHPPLAGWGPFVMEPIPPPGGSAVDVRVFSPGRVRVGVTSVAFRRVGP